MCLHEYKMYLDTTYYMDIGTVHIFSRNHNPFHLMFVSYLLRFIIKTMVRLGFEVTLLCFIFNIITYILQMLSDACEIFFVSNKQSGLCITLYVDRCMNRLEQYIRI